jgi:hypothetical protein
MTGSDDGTLGGEPGPGATPDVPFRRIVSAPDAPADDLRTRPFAVADAAVRGQAAVRAGSLALAQAATRAGNLALAQVLRRASAGVIGARR